MNAHAAILAQAKQQERAIGKLPPTTSTHLVTRPTRRPETSTKRPKAGRRRKTRRRSK